MEANETKGNEMNTEHADICKDVAMDNLMENCPELFVAKFNDFEAYDAETKKAEMIVREWLEDGTSTCYCEMSA